MNIVIPVYSEQELSPRSMEVLRGIVDDSYPGHVIKFQQSNSSDNKVLVFGKAPQVVPAHGVRYVYTYSIAQMMTKANAASVIKAALRQFIEEPEPVPFRKPLETLPLFIAELDFTKPTAIDIETSGNLGKEDTPDTVGIISVAFYQAGREPVVVAGANVINEAGFWYTEDLNERDVEILQGILPQFEKAIYHNGKFDIRVMNRVFGVNLINWFDTMLAHHVINIAAGSHGLKDLARRYLGAPDWESGLSKYTKNGGHYELIPVDKLVEYNGWDVYWTYKLYEFLLPLIEQDESNITALTLEMQAADFLLDVEKYGIPLDLEYATEYDAELTSRANEWLTDLRQITNNEKFNPASPKQVKEWLAGMGWDYGKSDEATLKEILELADPETDNFVIEFCKTLLDFRKVKKIQGTYVNGWVGQSRNGRVHPTYLVHGTSTGRLSSTRPNAQNMPREKQIRKVVRTNGDAA
jgi:DNA polymerase I-like protein with 3'-5' exonuclease and polymerase domains